MPSVVPTLTTEDPNFEQAINYSIHFSHKYTRLAEKFVKQQIAENRHLTPGQLKQQIENNMVQFMLTVKYILDSI